MSNQFSKAISDRILGVAGRYSADQIFRDWVEMYALAIANSLRFQHDKLWEQREKTFEDIKGKYNEAEIQAMTECFVFLVEGLKEDLADILGEAYMQAMMGSKITGQFFTPFDISVLCAEMGLGKMKDQLAAGEKISLNEPSCGSAGMVIAAAKVLKRNGINYQKSMRVICQDLDWRCVYMAYVQLSLLGIHARVVQGDTLCEPYGERYPSYRVLDTPARVGVLL